MRPWLADPRVVEIVANGPGVVFVEVMGEAAMRRFEVPRLTSAEIRHLCERVAGATDQAVNEEHPLLSAALPTGERFQGVLPPATTGGGFAIRKQVIQKLRLPDYLSMGAFERTIVVVDEELSEVDRELCALLHAREFAAFLALAVKSRISILISGGTSSGKTTFLNTLLAEVPSDERILTIEDTREVQPPHENHLPLIASKGDQGLARVTIESLLQASLRLRPDRIFLGEIRGAEAYSFLRAINTGHPGSITTVHADTPAGAIEQLSLMVMQAGLGLRKDEIAAYIRSVIPIIVQFRRMTGGERVMTHIEFSKMPLWLQKRGLQEPAQKRRGRKGRG
ncbi:MAG: P-type DNA transfer ATPase VirB11 [Rhodocyclaceae bacterium]|nr:P-type DNA transfer ATPase VirB11 [Rhodocyclaceae bacterium]